MVRRIGAELFDLPIDHSVQLVFLEIRAFWTGFKARIAADATEANDVGSLSGWDADYELFEKRIDRCVGRSSDKKTQML